MNLSLSKIEEFVTTLSEISDIDFRLYQKAQRTFSKTNNLPFFHKDELLKTYYHLVEKRIIKENRRLQKVLRLKQTRSLSGIVVVSVLTKPYECPGKCLYCPEEKGVPKSYLSDEPAVMRAITCHYHPYTQTISRLTALKNTGHSTSKINIRIIGATWSHYSKQYQTWFIKECFRACNDFDNNNIQDSANQKIHTLEYLQQINETAKSRIVEISIETRQDYIDKKEILRLRNLGVTKVELGIQSIFDDVLKFNRRGHNITKTIGAVALLKNAGFKISYQIMLNLPKSNIERDLKMMKELFSSPDFKPDYLKIYPLALVKEAPIYKLYKEKKFKPYSEKELIALLKEIKKIIPVYCRVERIIRDIPSQYIIEGGSKISNLRQVIGLELEKENSPCRCIRCREIRDNFNIKDKPELFVEKYESSHGKEYFISFESPDRNYLYSLLRLRLTNNPSIKILNDCAIVREIHTYGDQSEVAAIGDESAQHKGLGQRMLSEAEKIAKEIGYDKIAIISGIGVRSYFKKFGYKLKNTYMIKDLNTDNESN